MDFDPVLLQGRMGPMKAGGLWRGETVDTYVRRALRDCPDKTAIVAYGQGEPAPRRLSYRELDGLVDRAARNLARLGAGHGDVVSYQVPNSPEFMILSLACARIGAVANPIMPIFRQRELDFMLNFGQSRVFVVPKMFRGFDYEAMARGMLPDLPHLRQLVVVDGEGDDSGRGGVRMGLTERLFVGVCAHCTTLSEAALRTAFRQLDANGDSDLQW